MVSDTVFDGYVALITGGASGIGRSLASALVERGGAVVLVDRNEPEPFGPSDRVAFVAGDVADIDTHHRAVVTAREQFGGLDAFVGNAGVHDGGRGVLDLDLEELDAVVRRLLQINVVGYLLGARAAAEEVRRRSGTMVFTLSDAAFHVSGVGAGIAYIVSKHAALGIVRGLAAQLAPGVRVNAVAPGGVLTGLRAVNADAPDHEHELFTDPIALEEQVRALNPLGEVLTVDELVRHYLFLLSPDSKGLTGHVLRPDGGLEVS